VILKGIVHNAESLSYSRQKLSRESEIDKILVTRILLKPLREGAFAI
jgi:hypothetical protein